MSRGLTNWAGTITFNASRFHRPTSVAQLQELVAGCGHVRALGTGHSFNRIADTEGDLVSVADLPKTMTIDEQRATVTVGAGVRYGELATFLNDRGLALPNLGSLPHISVAGACSTATLGSGSSNGILATSVSALELVAADGELAVMSREADGDRFCGAVVGLGAIGIVTSLTLDVVPAFTVRQYVYEDMPRRQFAANLQEILTTAYSVSVFTDWQRSRLHQVWLKRREDDAVAWVPEPEWLGARLADGPRHVLAGMPAINCTEQLGIPGPWHARLPHFRLEFTPSSGAEIQSEYLVPAGQAPDALGALDELSTQLATLVQVSEIRSVAQDDLWMSPCYQRDTVAIHFTWIPDTPAVEALLPAIEARLAPFAPRPHWGKFFTTAPETIHAQYDRLPEFQLLLSRMDPAGKFSNEFIDRYIWDQRHNRR